MFMLLLAWGIFDCNLDSNNTIFYHFVVVLELKENYGADFWQARLNNNRIGNEIWTDKKKQKKRDNLIQFLIKRELLKNLQPTKFSSKVYKAIGY